MRPGEVKDIHTGLVECLGTPVLANMVNYAALAAGLPGADSSPSSAESLYRMLGTRDAQTFRITEKVTEAIPGIVREHNDDMTMDAFKPPSLIGVAVLEKPISFVEPSGHVQLAHIIAWIPLASMKPDGKAVIGNMVLLINDAGRQADHFAQKVTSEVSHNPEAVSRLRSAGGFFPIQFVFYFPFTSTGSAVQLVAKELKAEIRARDGQPVDEVPNLSRILLALWDLMSRIPEVDDEGFEPLHVERSAARRAQRAGLTPAVREVALHPPRRRPPDPDREHHARRALDHTVRVREHTRMQAYGPNRSLRKQIVISSYTYGPEDPPGHVPSTRVYRVD
jgi:hypothetical protein